jgi:hypothetical protein
MTCFVAFEEWEGAVNEILQDYLSTLYLALRSPGLFASDTPPLILAYAKGLREHPSERELEEFFGTRPKLPGLMQKQVQLAW